jgi:hypothetical protein
LRRPAILLVLAFVVYDGVSPAPLSIPSIGVWDTYRICVQQSWVDQATLIMSVGMLAFTVTYLLTLPERAMAAPDAPGAGAAVRALDWRLLALACVRSLA